MTSFRFLHTADLHLGSPFQSAARRFPQPWVKVLRDAAETVFERIVDAAIENHVDFVTIAGDLFDTDKAAMSAQFALLHGFTRLAEVGIEVVIIHGNHDPLLYSKGPIGWPDNVHVLGACERVVPENSGLANSFERAPAVVLTTKDGSRVQVSGFSYTQSELRRPMHQVFQRLQQVDFAIGLYHGVVGVAGPHENYCPTSVAELHRRNFDFWGLGHIHQPQVLKTQSPAIVYPGNPQGRHSREQGMRGCTLVKVQGRTQIQLQFVPTAKVLWQDVTIDIGECKDLTQVLRRCTQHLREELYPRLRDSDSDLKAHQNNLHGEMYRNESHSENLYQHDAFQRDMLSVKPPRKPVQKVIVGVTLTGTTKVHYWLNNDTDAHDNLLEELMRRLPDLFISDVRVQTTPVANLAGLAQSQEFIGDFLRLCRNYLEHPKEVRKVLAPLLEEVFHEANELAVDDMTDDELCGLIEQAQRHVLGFVGEEGYR